MGVQMGAKSLLNDLSDHPDRPSPGLHETLFSL